VLVAAVVVAAELVLAVVAAEVGAVAVAEVAAVVEVVAPVLLPGGSRVCRKLPRRLLRQREVPMRLSGHLDCTAMPLLLRLRESRK
jgi:hypothetical protein